MPATSMGQERRVVPRWRDVRTTARRGELGPLKRPSGRLALPDSEGLLAQKLHDWDVNPSLPFAAEVTATAFILGNYEPAHEAAEFVLANEASTSLTALATRVLGMTSKEEPASSPLPLPELRPLIHTIRGRLREDPRDALLWVDLALCYTILGQNQPARSAIENALRLAPANRHALRSAARLAVHLNEPDWGHDLLIRSPSIREDPWLLSAELATASVAGRQPRFFRQARQVLSAEKNSPFDLSELASAIATDELYAGATKKARRLFRTSLRIPTENAIAQSEWASSIIGNFEVERDRGQSPEAEARLASNNGDWTDAIRNCWHWHWDEPFSSRPCLHGSYVATIALEDFQQAIHLADAGLQSNPGDFGLLNNLSFAHASGGNLVAARESFDRIEPSKLEPPQRAVWLATSGFIAFREGRPDEGRRGYLAAIAEAGAQNPRLRVVAGLFWALEESLAGGDQAVNHGLRALDASKDVPGKEIEQLRSRLRRSLGLAPDDSLDRT